MLYLCRKQLNPLQRRFAMLFSITLLATAVLYSVQVSFAEGYFGFNHGQSARPLGYLLDILPAIPFLAMMFIIPRYLAQEKDEFVRMLVMRALLLGFAVPMVIDTVCGFLWIILAASAGPGILKVMPMLNVDLFCATALIALRLEGRRYQ
jgi:ABC-type microcin C transport system permease subunit YejE